MDSASGRGESGRRGEASGNRPRNVELSPRGRSVEAVEAVEAACDPQSRLGIVGVTNKASDASGLSLYF